jgi:hypothetical protein
MAQPIKYNTGVKTTGCCIRKGNYDIGIVQNRQYGPTVNTGFWNGYDVPSGGFVSFQNKASQGPSIYSIPDEASLVDYGAQLNLGGSYTTRQEVLQRCSELNTIALVNIEYPELPSIDNNILTLDVGYTASYPWTGTNWGNIAGDSITGGTIIGSVIFDKGTSGKNYSDSRLVYVQDVWTEVLPFGGTLSNFTINAFIITGSFGNQNSNLVSQRYSQDLLYTPETDCNFFIRGNSGGNGFEGGFRVGGVDYVVDTGNVGLGMMINISLTFDGSELIIYLNGSQKGTLTISPTLVSNNLNTIIGGSVNGLSGGSLPDYFRGRINVVNIYDVALDGTQIGDLYNAYVNRF